jgi:hypothetical protein
LTGDSVSFDESIIDASNNEETDDHKLLPTTNTGVLFRPIHEKSRNYIGNHVLLNRFGHCLVRRNTKLEANRRQQNFLQGIVARSEGRAIPLIYPEAMIHLSIFPFSFHDGSVIGSITSGMLFQDQTLHRHGLGGLHDHFRMRLTNPALLTSSDFRYVFNCFDHLTNLGLRGEDTRLLLSRGFISNGPEGCIKVDGKHSGPLLETDCVDSRPVVLKLGAACVEKTPTYFLTKTANQAEDMGLRRITKWLKSETLTEKIQEIVGDSSKQIHAMRKSILASSAVLMTRTWMETSDIYMRYIIYSPEHPIGEIDNAWHRHEIQDLDIDKHNKKSSQSNVGNLSHLHAILWTKDDITTPEGLDKVLDRIRGSGKDLIRLDEIADLSQRNLLKKDKELSYYQQWHVRVNGHKCARRCHIPEKKGYKHSGCEAN